MISDFKQIQELFKETDQKLTSNINIYIIGGAVLLYQDLKAATKDIDVILPNKESYSTFLKALTSIGFKRKEPTETYKKMEINVITVMVFLKNFQHDSLFRTHFDFFNLK